MRSRHVALPVALVFAFAAPFTAPAQQPAPLPATGDTAAGPTRLRIFLDCNFCAFDFMRTEITFVDYVRDRQAAQVHILLPHQQPGGGGTEYTIHFIGLRELRTISDTVT